MLNNNELNQYFVLKRNKHVHNSQYNTNVVETIFSSSPRGFEKPLRVQIIDLKIPI